jgi:hypothetical protein
VNTSNPSAGLGSVSCAAPGSCVAVGSYRDRSNNIAPLLETLSGGVWVARRAPLPADVSGTGATAALSRVTCLTVARCEAIGAYQGLNARWRTMIESSIGPVWIAARAPAPAGVSASTATLGLDAVTCGDARSCVAVGSYADQLGHEGPLIETLAAGRWHATTASLPPDAEGPQSAGLGAVSCGGVGFCAAVGNYVPAGRSSTGMLDVLSNGVWTSVEMPRPAAYPYISATLSDISCWGPTSCTAVGSGQTNILTSELFALHYESGTWVGEVLPAPPDDDVGIWAIGPSAVSCLPSGACAAVGQDKPDDIFNGPEHGFIESSG